MGKIFYVREPPVENLLPQFVCSQLSTTCFMLLKYPNGQIQVAVDHMQPASETSEWINNWNGVRDCISN